MGGERKVRGNGEGKEKEVREKEEREKEGRRKRGEGGER